MLDYTELEEIIDNFREELTLANRIGKEELELFLKKHNIDNLKKEKGYSYCDVRNSKILIVGKLNIKKKDIDGLCKSMKIDPERLDYVSYDEATNYPYDHLRFSNKYSDVIFGGTPHMGSGIGNSSSIITYLESNPSEFPNIIRACDSNSLNINKTSLKKSLSKTRIYQELLN